ncbi:MAG: aminotransferase class I/II-fold pyridoxal phosphate-dependent enzyme [candidate division Zixibacteria bacterium]|nr:aminotransferase class I/II-fold pyridoxal phosphate-dependent enzyme [candidate division Zixibacteria bacterium]
MRKIILDKAERLYKTQGPLSFEQPRLPAGSKYRESGVIELSSVRCELFSNPDFAGEAGGIIGNPGLRRGATKAEIVDAYKYIAEFYVKQFGIKLNHRTSIAIITAGIPSEMLISLGLVNPGDKIAVCDPASIVFRNAATMAGASVSSIPVNERTDYLASSSITDRRVERNLKIKFLNYPHIPSGAAADSSFFDAQVKAAAKGNYLLCHRWGSLAINRGRYSHPSIFHSSGAKKVGIEFTGFDIGYGFQKGLLEFAVGSPDAIAIIKEMNSAVCRDIPFFILKLFYSAIDHYETIAKETSERIKINADILSSGLKKLGWSVYNSKGTPFVWVKHPRRRSSVNLARSLWRRAGISVIPGVKFGDNGEGYIRIALTGTEQELEEAINRIAKVLHPIKSGKNMIDKRLKGFKGEQDSD